MHQKKSFAGGSAWRDPAFLGGLGFIVVITAAYLAGGFTILESIGLNSVVKGQIENSLKLALACVMGSMIGLERGNKNRPAGIRTNALVCTGSTLIMIISFDLFFLNTII